MNTPITTYYKDRDGKPGAKTEVMLDNTRRLTLHTSKYNKTLRSGASVMTRGVDSWSCIMDFGVGGGDFNIYRVAESKPARATEKVVKEQHDAVDFNALVAQAKAFYHIV